MRIVIATPLYPPDIAEPAPYTKELARRLSSKNDVFIVTYGHLPEKVPGVHIVAVDKRRILPVRLFAYTRALMSAASNADIIYAQNGPSVELPLLLTSLIRHKPVVIHLGDMAAHAYAAKHFFRRALERLTLNYAREVVTDVPLPRPESLPLEEKPETALKTYEVSWIRHVDSLYTIFRHAS